MALREKERGEGGGRRGKEEGKNHVLCDFPVSCDILGRHFPRTL